MGNRGSTGSGSGGGNSRRRNSHHQQPPPPPLGPPAQQQPEVGANRYVFAAATPYPPQYPNPNTPQYYQYEYYPPPPPAMPVPLPTPFDHHHPGWVDGGRYPYPPSPTVTAPYFEHQKAVTIRNDINLKKETLSVEPDEQNPGRFLVAFTFDATVSGSITVYFFAKEGFDCNLTSTMENLLKPVTVLFQEGLGQKFRQPSGTGIDFSMFEEAELIKEGETEVYPLAVKAESSPSNNQGPVGENQKIGTPDSQITQAVFQKKENGEYQVRVVKQILWVNGTRYELQEIYGIGNSVEGDFDGNDPGKECVICLSEPRDTTVLPCRHMISYLCEKPGAFFCNAGDPGARMLGIGCLSKPHLLGCKCMCSECAKVLRFQTNRCPICRQPVERLLEIKVNKGAEEQHESQ